MKAITLCVAAILLCGIPAVASPPTPEQQQSLDQYTALERAGKAALKAGDFVTAESDFRAAFAAFTATMPPGLEALLPANYELAEALTGEGRTAEAMQIYQTTLPPAVPGKNFGQSDVIARLHYALLLDQTGQWQQALARFEEAVPGLPGGELPKVEMHFDPNLPQPMLLAALAHIGLGLEMNFTSGNDKALEEYGKALQLAPDSDLANYYYGYGLQQVGQVTQARAAFTKTIKMARGGVKSAAEKALKKMKKPA